MILAPYGKIPGAYPSEIGYSYGGDGTFLCPDDPYYNQRGEIGFYHDTQLGTPITEWSVVAPILSTLRSILPKVNASNRGYFANRRLQRSGAMRGLGLAGLGRTIPTDFDWAPTYGYVPQMDGFVYAKEGFHPGSWIPPNGYDPAGGFGPPGFQGPNLSDIPAAPIDPNVANVLAAMNEQNSKMFTLSLLTTLAIGISAIITITRNAKAMRAEAKASNREARAIESLTP
jgi:hypothetical protein